MLTVEDLRDLSAEFHPSAPTASFKPEISPMPTAEISGVRLPRPRFGRSFTGIGCWNSRGSNLRSSLAAMLGDAFAYVETPEFLVRRLQLRHGADRGSYAAVLQRMLFHSTATKDWHGYGSFRPSSIDADREVRQLNGSIPAPLQRSLTRLAMQASMDDAAAAVLARVLLDAKFQQAITRRSNLLTLVKNRNKMEEQPEDFIVMWATVYPEVASSFYGPSVLVYEVDVEQRSADISYLARLLERGFQLGMPANAATCTDSYGWKNAYGGHCHDFMTDGHCTGRGFVVGHEWASAPAFGSAGEHCCVCGKADEAAIATPPELYDLGRMDASGLMSASRGNRPNSDLGQLVYPGYVRPSEVSGFELRDGGSRDLIGAARIEVGAYKWTLTDDQDHAPEGHGQSVVVIVETADTAGGPPACITHEGSGAHGPVPRLFACKSEGGWTNGRIPPLPTEDTSRPVAIAAIVFALEPTDHEDAQMATCEAARSALAASHRPRDGDGLSKWPRIAAAIDATRVNCDGHALTLSSAAVSCAELVSHGRDRISELRGVRPYVDDRFGWGPLEWHLIASDCL